MSGSSMVTFLVLLLLGFIGFVVYFIFKILQFVIVSVNLYKKMVNRQDAMIKLLIDLRDKTKKYDKKTAVDSADDLPPNSDNDYVSTDYTKYVKEDTEPLKEKTIQNSEPFREPRAVAYCPKCESPYREGFTTCADCGVDLIKYIDDPFFCHHCGEMLSQQRIEEIKRCPKCNKAL